MAVDSACDVAATMGVAMGMAIFVAVGIMLARDFLSLSLSPAYGFGCSKNAFLPLSC